MNQKTQGKDHTLRLRLPHNLLWWLISQPPQLLWWMKVSELVTAWRWLIWLRYWWTRRRCEVSRLCLIRPRLNGVSQAMVHLGCKRPPLFLKSTVTWCTNQSNGLGQQQYEGTVLPSYTTLLRRMSRRSLVYESSSFHRSTIHLSQYL